MKSLYVKLSLWSLATLVFCVLAFFITNAILNQNALRRGDFYGRITTWQFDSARKAYERGGKDGLTEYLAELRRYFMAEHFLLDSANRDLLNGEDRGESVRKMAEPSRFPPIFPAPRIVIVRISDDGRFKFLVKLEGPIGFNNALPYFAIILGAIAAFSYALFRYLASPLRQLSSAVERFGQGDFSARATVRRNDEFGLLGDRFNQMAGRIQTLLAAERRLLEDVSHELRSPLARLHFAVELARTSSDKDSALNRMRREIDRLSSLVGQLLEVTRAEGDPDARVREALDLGALAAEIVDDCRIEAEAKQCRIALKTSAGLELIADRELLRRALENVLRNAIRYAPERSTIELNLEKQAQAAAIHIRDFGPGVPDEMLDRIFQPFFRVDPSRDQSSGGVGLGLAIARRAVTLHHGQLKAENAQPGLRVNIQIPLVITSRFQ